MPNRILFDMNIAQVNKVLIAFYFNKIKNLSFISFTYVHIKWMGFISQKVFYLDFKTELLNENINKPLRILLRSCVVLSLKNYFEQHISWLFLSLHFATIYF